MNDSTFYGAPRRFVANGFRSLAPDLLQAFFKDLSLTALTPHMARVQTYFQKEEKRDPFLDELRFLNRAAIVLSLSPDKTRVRALSASEERSRAYRDLLRQWSALGECEAPSLEDLLNTSTRYLARAGITPCGTLFADVKTGFSQNAKEKALSLSLTGTVASLQKKDGAALPAHAALLFLPMAKEELSPFLEENGRYGVTPIALVGKEGVLPHLLKTNGVTLDVTAAEDATEEIPSTIATNGLLFAAPEAALPTLFATQHPIRLLGTLSQTGKLFAVRGGIVQTAPTLDFLRSLTTESYKEITCTEQFSSLPAPLFVSNDETILGGIECEANADLALLSLAVAAVREGADLSRCTLCALLEYPEGESDTSLGDAAALALGWHRATSELTLPSARNAVLSTAVEKVRLSLFLAAKKGEPREIVTPTDWQAARDIFFAK